MARGDCEEFAILLAVIYQGAGYRSAVAFSPGHAAALLYLPGYQGANQIFALDGEPGWIWLEATGSTNRFGWFPVGQVERPILAYELSPDEHLPLWQPPDEDVPPPDPDPEPTPEPAPSRTRHIGGIFLAIVIVSAVMGLVIVLARTSARRRG